MVCLGEDHTHTILGSGQWLIKSPTWYGQFTRTVYTTVLFLFHYLPFQSHSCFISVPFPFHYSCFHFIPYPHHPSLIPSLPRSRSQSSQVSFPVYPGLVPSLARSHSHYMHQFMRYFWPLFLVPDICCAGSGGICSQL